MEQKLGPFRGKLSVLLKRKNGEYTLDTQNNYLMLKIDANEMSKEMESQHIKRKCHLK